MISLFILIALTLTPEPQLGQMMDGEQKAYLMKLSEKFAELSLATLNESETVRNKNTSDLFLFLYDNSHALYSDALYQTMNKGGLYTDSELEKKLDDRLDHLTSRFDHFKSEVRKNYDSKKYCGLCAIVFYLGYREQSIQWLEEKKLADPYDNEVFGLVGVLKHGISLEASAIDKLRGQLTEATSLEEKGKIALQLYYLQINRTVREKIGIDENQTTDFKKLMNMLNESTNKFDGMKQEKKYAI